MSEEPTVLNESYLVRRWRDSARSPWHATVHKVRSGQMIHFIRTEDVWTYLQTQMAEIHLQHPDPVPAASKKREVAIE